MAAVFFGSQSQLVRAIAKLISTREGGNIFLSCKWLASWALVKNFSRMRPVKQYETPFPLLA